MLYKNNHKKYFKNLVIFLARSAENKIIEAKFLQYKDVAEIKKIKKEEKRSNRMLTESTNLQLMFVLIKQRAFSLDWNGNHTNGLVWNR